MSRNNDTIAAAVADGPYNVLNPNAAVTDFNADIYCCPEASAALYARKHHSTVYSATTCSPAAQQYHASELCILTMPQVWPCGRIVRPAA